MKSSPNSFLRAALLAASVILTTGAASAVTLGTWTATKPITNETTASPTLGNGSDGNAGAIMYASFPTITLTNVGDSLTLSGSFTLAGGVAGVNQAFRFGLFDNNGSTDAMNWRGYLGVTSPDASTIFERFTQTSGDFLSTSGTAATALTGTTNVGGGNAPASGAFTFSETITKTATGVSLSYSVTGPSGYSWSGSNTDTTPNFGVTPIEYDRVGIGFSGGYSADQAVFSNITVTETTSNYNTWLPTATPLNSRATLAWSAVAGAASYNVKRATSPSGPFVTVNTGATSPYTDAPLLNGTPYYYQITAVASGLETATSNTVSVTPTITTGTPAMMFGDSVRLKRPFAKDPTVVRFGGRYLMYYTQKDTSGKWSAGIAESTNLVDWSRAGEFLPGTTGPDKNGLAAPCGRVVNGKVELFYQSYTGQPSDRICNATSTDGITFTRNPANAIFGPSGVWNNGRAIDADYIEYNGRMILSCATRDPANLIQQVVVADAPIGPDYSSSVWRMLTPAAPTFPPIQTSWEQTCIEGQTMCVRNNKLFMFYGGAYNNAPQQIGIASSTDGANWTRLPSLGGNPFFPDGAAGTWNSSESGHPGIFIDDDDQTYMFYQGNNDNGNTWFLSVLKIGWNGDVPFIKPGIARIPDRTVPLGASTSAAIALMFPVPDADTLTLSATSSNPALIPNSNLTFTGTGCGRILSTTPAANTAGIATISVNATAPSGHSDTATYQITVGSPLEIWNQQWFGTPFATGDAASAADPNHDGETNLLEFATGQNPNAATRASTAIAIAANATLNYTYIRSKAAIANSIAYSVEWSDNLSAGSWTETDVIQQFSSLDNGDSIQTTAQIPVGNANKRFVRLRIYQSP